MVYIQVDNDGIPFFDACFAMYEYCASRDIDYKLVKPYELGFIDSYGVFVGSVEMTRAFIRRTVDKAFKFIDTYPKELSEFYGRDIEEMTLGYFGSLANFNGKPFIKPKSCKLFNGGLRAYADIISEIPKESLAKANDIECYASSYIRLESEFRCFIYKGQVMGVQNYSGKPTIFPKIDVIDRIIKKYKTAPIAYCLDVGITNRAKTVIVEVNDVLASGAYGFDYKLFEMYTERYQEIRGNRGG